MDSGGIDVQERVAAARSWQIAPYVIIGVAAVVYLLRIDAFGLTGDEGFTARMVALGWRDMLGDLMNIDYNMSVHYVSLKAWSSVLGTSEPALRSLSAIAVLVAGALLFRWMDRRFGRLVGLVAIVLLLFNPYVVALALTARPYALLILWSVGATWLLDRAVASTESTAAWLLYGAVAVVGIHIHLLAVLVIGAHAVYALGVARRLLWVHGEAAALIIALGLVPTLLFIAPSDTLSWIPPLTPRRMVDVGISVAGGPLFALFAIPLVIVGLVRPPAVGPRWLPAVWLLVPLAGFVALIPIQSLFVSDYFAPVVAAGSVITAFGIVRVLSARPGLAIAVAAGICVLGIVGGWSSFGATSPSQAWRDLAASMVGRVEVGDGVAYPNAYYRIVGEYYGPDSTGSPFPPAEPALPVAPWGTASPYEIDLLKRTGFYEPHGMFEPALVDWRRVWVVGTEDVLSEAVLDDLVAHGYVEADVVTSGAVSARLFVVNGLAASHEDETHDDSG